MIKFLKNLFAIKVTPQKSANPRTTATWYVQQYTTCPFCGQKFDIVETKLKRGDMYPPYFGAMMEDTEFLDEKIQCPYCRNVIVIIETYWDAF